jgi:hypothetical protein
MGQKNKSPATSCSFEVDDPQEIQERDLLRGYPFDYSSLTSGSHTSVTVTKEKSRLNPKNQPSDQTLRTEAVQSLYNKNCVNVKPVF